MPVRKKIEDLKNTTPADKFKNIFPVVKKPVAGQPLMPAKLSAVASEDLGDLMAQYSVWREYCEDLHLVAVAELMQSKETYEMKRAQLMIMANGATVADKKASVDGSEEIKPLAIDYTDKDIYATMLGAKLESYTNTLQVLSRELTRRGSMA